MDQRNHGETRWFETKPGFLNRTCLTRVSGLIFHLRQCQDGVENRYKRQHNIRSCQGAHDDQGQQDGLRKPFRDEKENETRCVPMDWVRVARSIIEDRPNPVSTANYVSKQHQIRFNGVVHRYSISLFGHSHDSHQFSLLFSFIIINGGNGKMRMEEKSKGKLWESWLLWNPLILLRMQLMEKRTQLQATLCMVWYHSMRDYLVQSLIC